jgi:hypothetical protein
MNHGKYIALLIVAGLLFPAGKSFSQESALTVPELILCRQVTDEGPKNAAGEFFDNVGSVCCQTRIEGTTGTEKITHVWYYGSVKQETFKFEVDSASNTIHSCVEVKPGMLGLWKVEVLDAQGIVLKSQPFFIKGIPDKPERGDGRSVFVDIGIKVKLKSDMRISEMKIGRSVRGRKISGETLNVPPSWKKVFCWISLPDVKKESSVKFVWYYFKKKMAETIVEIKPPACAVWAFKTMRPQYVGDWCVEVLDEEDRFIRELCFNVKEQ